MLTFAYIDVRRHRLKQVNTAYVNIIYVTCHKILWTFLATNLALTRISSWFSADWFSQFVLDCLVFSGAAATG